MLRIPADRPFQPVGLVLALLWGILSCPSPASGPGQALADHLRFMSGRLDFAVGNPSGVGSWHFPVDLTPSDVVIEDFNLDGRPDLAVPMQVHFSSSGPPGVVSILLQSPVDTQPAFQPAANYETGSGPSAIASGDLNGDGWIDLVTVNAYDDNLSVLVGTGYGAFALWSNLTAGNTPSAIAIGDLDQDGAPDLVCSNQVSNDVSVFWGLGNLDFTGPTTFATGLSPLGVALADFNVDGKPDIATADRDGNSVTLLLNVGSRRFASPASFNTSPGPTSITVADLDQDMVPDVVITSTTRDQVTIHRGFSNGTLGAPQNYAAGTNPVRVAVGDLDGDGVLDLAVANRTSVIGSLCTLRGHGDMSFDPRQFHFGADTPFSIAMADLNGDGAKDLVLPNSGELGYPRFGSSVGVFYGSGSLGFGSGLSQPLTEQTQVGGVGVVSDIDDSGVLDLVVVSKPNLSATCIVEAFPGAANGFFLAPPVTSTGVSATPRVLRAADMNRDGAPDLVVGATNGVSVQLGTGGGAFGSAILGSSATTVEDLEIGDLNRDGIPDVVADVSPTGSTHELRVLLGTGTGALSLFATYPIEVDDNGLELGDLNRDGILDLVYTPVPFAGVAVRLGAGTGAFGSPLASAANREMWFPILLDSNRDGLLDVAVYDQGDGIAGEMAGIAVLTGLGNGLFGPLIKTALTQSTAGSSLAAWDLNADGFEDLVAKEGDLGQFRSMAASALLGNGTGQFGAQSLYGLGSYSTTPLLIGDLDRDGRDDMVSLLDDGEFPGAPNAWIHILRGNRPALPGTFAGPINNPTFGSAAALAVGDLNRDGKLDAAVAENFGGAAGILLGNGNGTLGSDTNYPASAGASAVALGDLNRDGIPDLVTAGSVPYGVDVLLGAGNGVYSAPTHYAGGGNVATDVELVDLDRDGKLDVLLATGLGGGVVYLGQGNGTLGAASSLSVGGYYVYDIGPTDTDGDGKVDLVIATGEWATILVLPGNGDGTFGLAQTYSMLGDECYHLAVGDMNRDGQPDVVVDRAGMPGISVVIGNGSFGFTTHYDYALAQAPQGLAIGDLDKDGALDVAACLSGANLVSAFRGAGDGTLLPKSDYPTGISPQSVAIADMNRDGRPDLVTGNWSGFSVSILLGGGSGVPTGAPSGAAPPVTRATLEQNRPNPFNPRTTIGYSLPTPGLVRLRVFDARGRLVAILVDGQEPAGRREVAWSGKDGQGRTLPSGVYFYRLEAAGATQSRRMVLLQ